MDEENGVSEIKEKIEEVTEHAGSWNRYLALTTAIIAVIAAVSSLLSGSYANEALLHKNDAVLDQNKASDQWTYYDTKGVKRDIAESFYQQFNTDSEKSNIAKYDKQLQDIQKQARVYEHLVTLANDASNISLEKHHQESIALTFFQIAIALSAMSALLRRKSFWVISIITALFGIVYFLLGLR